MLTAETILQALPHALEKLEVPGDLPRGKVRDFYMLDDGKRRVLISTDRLNIFGQMVGLVPFKGQILNELSAWWFENTADIIANHFISAPDPNVTIARETHPIQLEVVVRGYITGVSPTSLWTRYANGEREFYGTKLPDGLRKNDPLPQVIVTPASKSTVGRNDRMILDDVVGKKYVDASTWQHMQEIALALYERGHDIAAKRGLILADTKYEFGRDEETHDLLLIDELHTPDSSRFWDAASYADRVHHGAEPDNLDIEMVRLWYVSQHDGNGKQPVNISQDLIIATSQSYQRVYEMLMGQPFRPSAYPAQDRIQEAIATLV